jgi:Histidine kinase-, DNA gyrase B-, and HSP90-like ATPase/Cyclic nucleotide-binding domain
MPYIKDSYSIKNNKLFNGLRPEKTNIKTDTKNFINFKEGDIIYQTGDEANYFYLVVEGSLKLKFTGWKGKDFITKETGDFIGEKEIFDEIRRQSSAVANADSVLYKIGAKELKALIKKIPQLYDNIIEFNSGDYKNIELSENENGDTMNPLPIDLEKDTVKIKDNTKIKKPITEETQEKSTASESYNTEQYFPNSEKENNNIEKKDEVQDFISEEESFPDVSLDESEEINYDSTKEDTGSIDNPEENNSTHLLEEKPNTENHESKQNPEKISWESLPGMSGEKSSEEKQKEDKREHPNIGHIINFISSDLAYPTSIIKYYINLLQKNTGDEEVGKILNSLSTQADNIMAVLISTLNYFTGNDVYKQEVLSFETVMNNILDSLSEYVESREMKLFKKFTGDAKVKIDRGLFYVVCYQIIRNSCDAMTSGGNIFVSSLKEENKIELEIKDEGKGIKDEIKEKVFTPFFSYGKENAQGLGLAISAKIMQAHEGEITFYPAEGVGTIFKITLPTVQ